MHLPLTYICYVGLNHRPVLSSFLIYHRICNKSGITDVTCGAGTAYPSGETQFTPVCRWGLCCTVSFLSSVLWCRYDFSIKTMLSSSLPPVVCIIYVICVCAFVHIALVFFSYFVLCIICIQFLWIVNFLIAPSVFWHVYLIQWLLMQTDLWKEEKQKKSNVYPILT